MVLFDGSNPSSWVGLDGSATKWIAKDGALECVPGSGYARTLQSFGDCQLHIEWAAPTNVQGESQSRGNSGVFFGLDRYEIQVLDSYQNKTYADGSAASIYGQYPPLVNASRSPGQWQAFDIIWTAPRFGLHGELTSPARITVMHNGVLVQNNVELLGPTSWVGRESYKAHPSRLPISIQDHGNPVRYRNIWVRELGNHRYPAYYLSNSVLDGYVGVYGSQHEKSLVKIRRLPDGQLGMTLAGAELVLTAASPNHFVSAGTDVQARFEFEGSVLRLRMSVGDDFSRSINIERMPSKIPILQRDSRNIALA